VTIDFFVVRPRFPPTAREGLIQYEFGCRTCLAKQLTLNKYHAGHAQDAEVLLSFDSLHHRFDIQTSSQCKNGRNDRCAIGSPGQICNK